MSGAILFRPAPWFVAVLCLATSTLHAEESASRSQPPTSPYPLQLESVVPHAPTAFASVGRQHLVYELVLRNFEAKTLELQQLEVLDAERRDAAPVAMFTADALPALVRRVGGRTQEPGTIIPSSGSVTVYLMLSFDAGVPVPTQLQHRLTTSAGALITEPVLIDDDAVPVLGAPVTGSNWLAETGLSNDNGHRRGNMLQHGHSVISRRYAFDWVQVENGEMLAGAENSNASYFAYGEPLVAVADAIVVTVMDAVPENVPGRAPAIPINLSNTTGNTVVLDIGGGHYAHYMHLKDDSLRVKAGDRVRRGQVLGVIGNSGDSFVPHLHFEVTTSPAALAGEGMPYVIDSFQVIGGEGRAPVMHSAELPLEKMVVNFGG